MTITDSRINIVKIDILPKAIYKFIADTIKFATQFFIEIKKQNLKNIHMEAQNA